MAGFLATQLRTSDGAYPLRVKSSPLPCTICPSRFQVYVQGGEQSAEHSKLDGTPTVITETRQGQRHIQVADYLSAGFGNSGMLEYFEASIQILWWYIDIHYLDKM